MSQSPESCEGRAQVSYRSRKELWEQIRNEQHLRKKDPDGHTGQGREEQAGWQHTPRWGDAGFRTNQQTHHMGHRASMLRTPMLIYAGARDGIRGGQELYLTCQCLGACPQLANLAHPTVGEAKHSLLCMPMGSWANSIQHLPGCFMVAQP